jgi:pimeloyl-ACP methyl ester carboxylesterase
MGKSRIPSFDRGFPVRRSYLAAFYAGARLVLLAQGSFIFSDATAPEERANASDRSMVYRHRLFDSSILFRTYRRLYMTPIEPAYAYFQQVKAPQKEFVLFKGGDHFIPLDRPDGFLTQLVEHVRPLVFSAKDERNE